MDTSSLINSGGFVSGTDIPYFLPAITGSEWVELNRRIISSSLTHFEFEEEDRTILLRILEEGDYSSSTELTLINDTSELWVSQSLLPSSSLLSEVVLPLPPNTGSLDDT